MSKKRIALFVGKLGGGGAERAASSLSLMLSEYFDVYVFVYNLKQCDYEHGGKLIDVSNGAKGFCFKALHTIININNVIRANKIDLVISFCEFPNIVNGLINHSCKSITSIRTYYKKGWAHTGWERVKYWLQNMAFCRADAVWTLTEAQKRILSEETKIAIDNVIVSGNIYDTSSIVRSALDKALDPKIIEFINSSTAVGIGRLDAGKNFETMLKIFSEVKKTYPEARLLILGDGKKRDDLIKLAKELEITDSVMLAGRVRNPFPYVRRCALYVATTLFEGFPNSLVEAMSLGIPVIHSDCPLGPRDILYQNSSVSHDNNIEYADYGILTPVCEGEREVKLISNVWKKLLIDDSFRLEYGRRAKKGAERYDKSKSAPIFAKKINEVINKC